MNNHTSPHKKNAQSMVEFALIIPILLLLILGIIEYGRLFFAWITIENAARSGARYASTGRYEIIFCEDGPDDGSEVCAGDGEDEEKNNARIASIKQEASSILFGNPFLQGVASSLESSIYTVTVCSKNEDEYTFTRPEMGGDIYSGCATLGGTPAEHPGEPGGRVVVSVDYNFPFIVPFFRNSQPIFHLGSYKEATVEQFRVSRVVNIDDDFELPDLPTATPQPTATPDCSNLSLDAFYINGDRLYASVSNAGSSNMPLTYSKLSWEYVGGSGPKVNWFQWSGRKYFDPNPDTSVSPTDATCSDSDCDFPAGQTYAWVADFNRATNPLFGQFNLELKFANDCKLTSDVVIVSTPTPDCDLITVKEAWFQNQQFRVKVRNDNPIDMPFSSAELSWPQKPANAVIDFYKWNWKTHYGGNTGASPYGADCVGDICSFPAFRDRVWVVDFNNLYSNRVTGYHEVNLNFAGMCNLSVALGPNCNLLAPGDMEVGDSGDYFKFGFTNNNPIPLRLSRETFTWPSSIFSIDGIWQGTWSNNYRWQNYTGDWDGNYSSPAIFTDPFIVEPNETYTWHTGLSNPDPAPLYGLFGLDLVFDDMCTISDTIDVATPTPTPTATFTPTPDCNLITAHNLRIDSSSNHNNDDNIIMEVRNDNPMPLTLTNTVFYWENPYGNGIDWFKFNEYQYYNGNDYSSPTTKSDTSLDIPAYTTYTWYTEFTGWNYPIYGSFQLNLDFEAGNVSCPVSATLEQSAPTATFTPTITRTPSRTPSPTRTPTPSPTPDCDDIVAGPLHVGTSGEEDNLLMNVTNNNPQPIFLTFTTFVWNNYYGNQLDWLIFGGSTYYGGNTYTSPFTRTSTIELPPGSTYVWNAEFTHYNYPLYGPYAVELTFEQDARCSVSGSYHLNTPTPSRTPTRTLTPIPTKTPTPSNTPSHTPSPTNTRTPTKTKTPTETAITTPTFTPSRTPTPTPTATIDFD